MQNQKVKGRFALGNRFVTRFSGALPFLRASMSSLDSAKASAACLGSPGTESNSHLFGLEDHQAFCRALDKQVPTPCLWGGGQDNCNSPAQKVHGNY